MKRNCASSWLFTKIIPRCSTEHKKQKFSVKSEFSSGVNKIYLRDFRLSLRCDEIYNLLGCYAADIGSYLPAFRDNLSVPISKGLPLENGTYRLSRNVGNYQSMLRNIPEEPRSDMCLLL